MCCVYTRDPSHSRRYGAPFQGNIRPFSHLKHRTGRHLPLDHHIFTIPSLSAFLRIRYGQTIIVDMIATDYVATRSLELSRGGSCYGVLPPSAVHLALAAAARQSLASHSSTTAKSAGVANALAVHCGCANRVKWDMAL